MPMPEMWMKSSAIAQNIFPQRSAEVRRKEILADRSMSKIGSSLCRVKINLYVFCI